MDGGEGWRQLCHDLTSSGSRTSLGGKRRLIRGGGSAAQISNGIRSQDPGGGEVRLTSSRDEAVAQPVLEPAFRKPVDTTVGGTTVWRGEGVCGVGRCDPEASGSACVHHS